MKSEAFVNYSDVTLTLVGLGLFIAVFFGSIAWVCIKENRRRYKIIATDILNDGEKV